MRGRGVSGHNAGRRRVSAGTPRRPAPVGRAEWVSVLQADPELAGRLPDSTVSDALPFAVAQAKWLDTGQWHPEHGVGEDAGGRLGLLVIEGFLARRVHVLDRPSTELLGRGDLLIPWEPDRTEPFTARARWEVLEPARVAMLDRRFTGIIGRWPELTAALLARAVSRSRALALTLAIGQLVGVELRLLVLLWHIAERWAAREAEGTVLPVHLTHELLASLISAQRATVTRALRTLTDEGRVSRAADGRLALHGGPPAQFRRLESELG
jgi:CRP/FNR family transcriptional regulator, cyclic AMP receptor protein